MKRPSLSQGFTLIELLVVIAIIGILSSVVLFSLNDARSGARDTRRVADLRQIQLKLESYYSDNDQYPADASAGACDDAEASGGLLEDLGLTGAGDPGSTTTYGYGAASDGQSYVLRAVLENDTHSSFDGDVDGTVLNCDCADASNYYCVQS
jgi:prepilin-type N-terminal cleavage/methylation domain-containing protein